MAKAARDTLNGIIDKIANGTAPNFVSNATSPTQTYGISGSQIYVKLNGVQNNVARVDLAVDKGVLWALPQTKIIGGDIFLKRAVANGIWPTVTEMLGDLQIASDYELYLRSAPVIDAAIGSSWNALSSGDKTFYTANKAFMTRAISASQIPLTGSDVSFYNGNQTQVDRIVNSTSVSSFAAGWIATLSRAAELKLDQFGAWDFFGGLTGFAQSFGFGRPISMESVVPLAYEKLDVTLEGTSVRIATRDATGPFGLLSASNNITDPVQAARSVLIPNFAASTGYTAWAGYGTNANDIQVATGNGAGVTSFAANGDDIVVGSTYDDQLYGQAGWDWLDGGLGNDYLDGGDNDDVLIGRNGVDRMLGGTGNDYLSGGEGDDYFNTWIGGAASGALNGNDGNDTLVGGTGIDALFGDNGDDVFVVDQDGASAPDYMDGGGGSDVASYERFTTGVNIDMGANPATNTSPSLASGTALYAGQSIFSPDGRFQMAYQTDGNLVAYGPNGVVWATYTNGSSTGVLAMQTAGNLVLYNGSGQVLWATDGGGNPGAAFYLQNTGRLSVFTTMGREIWNVAGGNLNGAATQPYASLLSGRTLGVGQAIFSPDGRFRLTYQADGNLVLYGPGGQAMWSSGTAGTTVGFVAMQTAGNLVVYNGSSQPVWATSGGGYNGAGLFVTDAGRLSLLMPNQQEIWTSNTGGGAAYAKRIYGDIWQSIENVTGSQYNDVLVGGAAANVVRGLGGNDSLAGSGGDDILEGGVGADTLNGGDGNDTASYTGSSSGVVVNLATGAALGGDASGDGFVSIESLRGSRYNDELTGNAGNNVIEGMAGDDTLVMTAGYDTLNGGDGLDTLDASGVGAAVTVSGSYAYLSGTYSLLSNIESFVGSAFADSLSGGTGDKIYDGGAGNDQLGGSTGSDTYLFGRGDGSDSVTETSDGANQIVLKDGINWRDVAIGGANYSAQNGNLAVSLRGTSDQIVVGGNFSYVNSGSSAGIHNHKIKTIDLGGASALDVGMIDWTPANAADEAATNTRGEQNRADIIFTYGGDDTIAVSNYTTSEQRDNIVYAGDGNDNVIGAMGDDQYIFERGNGVDTLTDVGGLDTIVMGPSVAAEDVIYQVVSTDEKGNSDLYIGLRDSNSPNAVASQVADRIRIVGGGAIYENLNTGQMTRRTVEYVRVAGQEIDLLKANIQWTSTTISSGDGPYAPVAFDLDGDGLELRSVEGSRMSVVEADGSIIRMGWLGQDDGFLALDRNGDGAIDRISEISFVNDLTGAKTDLEGLAAYDDNADGKLDAADKKWADFRVWKDKDQDGYGGRSELMTLAEAGVKAIELKGQATGFTATDGQDNIILATTKVEWTDTNRKGSGYDVMLAAQQVRTDGGGQAMAQAISTARGRGVADILDANLYGVQALTAGQVSAIKGRAGRPGDQAAGGGFFRVETLVNSGKAAVVDGLLNIAPTLAAQLAAAVRPIGNLLPGFLSPFAGSDWTRLGSVARGLADTSTDKVGFQPFALTAEQQATLTAAQARNVEQEALAARAAAERAAIDAADAAESERIQARGGIDPRNAPPGADGFQMLAAETDGETAAGMAAGAETPSEVAASPTAESAKAPDPVPSVGAASPAAQAEPANDVSAEPVQAPMNAAAESTDHPSPATVDGGKDSSPATAEEGAEQVVDYAVAISVANARLVQALASFGEAPAMMANYRGLNVANDAGAGMLTVDALPSVHRLAAIA